MSVINAVFYVVSLIETNPASPMSLTRDYIDVPILVPV